MLRIILGAVATIVIIAVAYYFGRRAGKTQFLPKVVGWTTIAYAVYLATLTSSAWTLVLPGVAPIGAGAATGALIGAGVFAVVGTLGIATGGLAIAAGMGTLVTVFGGVGAASGWVATMSSGGYGFRKVISPLVHWAFWIPIFLIGAYVLWNNSRKSKPTLPMTSDES